MNKKEANDKHILKLLEQSPQQGMVLLMEQYTGLIWKIISLHLENPEDIRECVNDTFSQFYFHKDRFDPEKASLVAYLSAIARKRAISRYRKERIRRAEPLEDKYTSADNQIALTELQADLDRAMSSLKPNELQIIRMKYYNGMTVQEIAASLDLPYETVKKRHQRSIGKLRRSLLLMLLLLLLLLVTACTYRILVHYDIIPDFWTELWDNVLPGTPEEKPDRDMPDTASRTAVPLRLSLPEPEENTPEEQSPLSVPAVSTASETVENEVFSFTVVPGYGINHNPDIPVYTLYEPSNAGNDFMDITLDDALYLNGTLSLKLSIQVKDDSTQPAMYSQGRSDSLHCGDQSWTRDYASDYGHSGSSLVNTEIGFYIQELPDSDTGSLDLILETSYGISIPFTLVLAAQETLVNYAYQMEEHGGLLAIPRLENGSLIVAVYPLNIAGDYDILPQLVDSQYGNAESGTLTVTGPDSTVSVGTRIRAKAYYASALYYEWDFGPASPGSYTLHVPFLYQAVDSPEDFGILLNLKDLTWEDKTYSIPGGCLRIESCMPAGFPAAGSDSMSSYAPPNPYSYWNVRIHYDSEDSNRPLADFHFVYRCIPTSYIANGGDPETYDFALSNESSNRIYALDETSGTLDLMVSLDESKYDASYFYLSFMEKRLLAPSYDCTINYRWNQSFDLSFTVN